MKNLQFIYQETEIHFALQNEGNVMINATDMAKHFNKKTKLFLKSDHAKAYIEVLKRAPNGAQIIDDRGRNGIYFERKLALKFAAWLSPEFEFWVFSTLDNILFGNYKTHWEAHKLQVKIENEIEEMKIKLLKDYSPGLFKEYLDLCQKAKQAKLAKSKAIRNQLKLSF